MTRHIIIMNGTKCIFNCDVNDLEIEFYRNSTDISFTYEGIKMTMEIPNDYELKIK